MGVFLSEGPVISLLVLFSCLCISAHAQTASGRIQGSVIDKSTSSAIENAEVLIEDTDGNVLLSQRSNAAGEFLLLAIPAGDYSLVIKKEGYPEYRIRSVRLGMGALSMVSVEMEQGKSEAPVMVLSAWPGRSSDPWESDQGARLDRQRMDGLPSARNIWALLQNQDPSSVTNHIDEGGMQTGVPALVGVHGGTWTQNGYRWDGLNITNPYDPGKPLSYPDLGSLEEFRVSGSQHAATISSSGAEFQFASRRGGRRSHGQVEAYYIGKNMQSSNLDDRLRKFGFRTTPHFDSFPEGEFSLGGPLPRTQGWSAFTSLGAQRVSRVIPDFAGSPTATIFSGLMRLDGPLKPHDDLSVLISGQIARNSNLGAGPGIAPSATLHGNDRYELVQGHWAHRQSERSIWELSFGFSHSSPTDTLQAGVTRPNATQLFTGEMTGAAPVESDSALSRFSLQGQIQTLRHGRRNWEHMLALGFDVEESLTTEERRVFQGLNLFYFPLNTPSEIAEFNSPSHAMQRLRELRFFAEDRMQIARRLFVRVGVNLDSSSVSLPEQVSGAGPFVPERKFAGNSSVVSWATLSPRLGLAVPVWRRFGETRLIAGLARYDHLLPAGYADYGNPNALGGRLYRWNDKNEDKLFQPGEEGTLLRVFGGPYSSVDSNLKRPRTSEYLIGLEHDFGRNVQVGVQLIRCDTRHLVAAVNLGIPMSAYVPVKVLDPGDDNIPGTSDDHVLTVFNQNPSTLGQDQYLLTNPAGLNTRYQGMEANLTGRPSEHGFFSVSFTAYSSEGDGNPGNSELENDAGVIGSLFDNPNTRINSRGRLFFDRAYVAKVLACWRAPLGFQLGSVISYFDGLPFGRKLIIPDLNQGPFFVMATPRGEPGGFRTQYNLNFDQRIARDFVLGSLRVTAMLDIFNLLNSNKNLRESDISGPSFVQRQPINVQNPRSFRLGIRLSF